MSTATITSWLLTYLIHSTVLLGSAWVACRLLGNRRFALQEILLRSALVGGLLTASLQIGFGIAPVGGALTIEHPASQQTVMAGGVARAGSTTPHAITTSPTISSEVGGHLWPAAVPVLWGLGSFLALVGLIRSVADLRRLLETRRFRPTGRLVEHLARLMGLRRSVRLSTSEAIAVPFATGIRKPEICCPERIGDLAYEHQKSLFAHELAHLARRDPAWQLLYRLGEAVLFLQPLNRLVRRRLEEIAEHLTDERAVACTGDRLGLARCLVVIAHWSVSNPLGVPATAFAAGPRLDRRVRHLISGNLGGRGKPKWTIAAAIALLLGSVVVLPAVTPSSAQADVSREATHASPTKTWSDAEDAPTPPKPPQPEAAPAPEIAGKPPVAPDPATAPALASVGAPPVAPAPAMAPAPAVEVAPVVVPAPEAVAAPVLAAPVSPAADDPPQPEEPPTPPAAEENARRQRDRAQEEVRARRREVERERSEAEARARECARAVREERRALAHEARELAREAAERARITEAEREKLRREAREQARLAMEQSRELAERSRALARETARMNQVEREELRSRAEALAREARERARDARREAAERARVLSEEARKLAEEAEAERRAEEERQRRDHKQD